jgi:hypothetical protein
MLKPPVSPRWWHLTLKGKIVAFDIFEQYATDETAEVAGVEMELGDAKFLIARTGNKKFSDKLSKLYKKNQRLLDRGDEAANKLSDTLMIDCIAEAILLGWSGVSYKGVDMPYSLENAKTLLAHKDFRKQIMALSEDVDAYKAKKDAEAEKN